MTRLIGSRENWEKAFEAFKSVNFAAFDYNTVKQSMIEYVKLYFPETFNDYIESSEFIAIIEVFAYLAELDSYRLDVDAHENFLLTAQLKTNVLRLAAFISYTASRNLPARGLVKITSITTTERVFDANGIDLTNRTIKWNDPNNPNWKNQFIQVMNRALEQPFGTVSPNSRFQIENVLFEIYNWNWIPVPNGTGVLSYSAQAANGVAVPMELVPVTFQSDEGIIERRPEQNSNFALLYGSDGLGDGSDLTGFFCFTKQGALQRFASTFDGVTPNQTYVVPTNAINEIDVWLNQVDPVTGIIVNEQDVFLQRPSTGTRSGEWMPVNTFKTQNVIFNTLIETMNKYQITTLDQDGVELVFGDGEFANIPNGTFDTWVRSSANQDLVIPQTAVIDQASTFRYLDLFGTAQTFTITYTLTSSLLNASASETIEHIRVTAPDVYYTQDRMVNGKDYNTFMLQDPSILRLRAVNRTFAGDSRYIEWRDPSGMYENVKIFGDDLIVYTETDTVSTFESTDSFTTLINTAIQPLLSSPDVFLYLISQGIPPSKIRRVFNQAEVTRIVTALTPPPSPAVVPMYFNKVNFEWYAVKTVQPPTFSNAQINSALQAIDPLYTYPTDYVLEPVIVVNQTSVFVNSYEIVHQSTKIIMESDTTQFWNTNQGDTVINYDTLNSDYDQIVILKANQDADRTHLLTQNFGFNILGQDLVPAGLPDAGLPDIHRVFTIPIDENQDRIPDNLQMTEILNPKLFNVTNSLVPADIELYEVPITLAPLQVMTLTYTLPTDLYGVVSLPVFATLDAPLYTQDLRINLDPLDAAVNISAILYDNGLESAPIPDIGSTGRLFNSFELTIANPSAVDPVTLTLSVDFLEYVYFQRFSAADPWLFVPATYNNLNDFVEYFIAINAALLADPNATIDLLWKRNNGRAGFNFAWFHNTPFYYLTDPASTNIIDMFIVTKGYYDSIRRWLADASLPQPTPPKPVDLRNSYNYLLENKMISDTVVMHPGNFKLLFGSRAIPQLRGTFKVIRNENATITDNQIKANIVSIVRNFFDIQFWQFGETFFFTELAAAIHAQLQTEIRSVVIVPSFAAEQFGNLFEVQAKEDEILQPDISVSDIEIVTVYNDVNIRITG